MTAGGLVVIAGTGTGIGKTTVACALLRACPPGCRVAGYKPIETGVEGEEGEDARALRGASPFHVEPRPRCWTFAPPISPHIAAREAGIALDGEAIAEEVLRLRAGVDCLVVELAGGLFSPLGPRFLNVDLVRLLNHDALLLVAPDRLGVLHDIGAATAAAVAVGVHVNGVILSAPAEPDASTGRNAEEVRVVTDTPVLASLPRASPSDLARHARVDKLLAIVTRR